MESEGESRWPPKFRCSSRGPVAAMFLHVHPYLAMIARVSLMLFLLFISPFTHFLCVIRAKILLLVVEGTMTSKRMVN